MGRGKRGRGGKEGYSESRRGCRVKRELAQSQVVGGGSGSTGGAGGAQALWVPRVGR